MKKTSLSIWAAAAILLSGGQSAFAAGTHAHQHGGASGEPGNAAEVSRTVEIVMRDNYYEPESIAVQKDETVRLVVKNEGVLVHEFNIGTAEMHAAHKDEMLMMMRHGVLSPTKIHRDKMEADDGHSMKHDDPNSVLLEPGETAEIVWKFAETAALEFACNVPGHYEAGMVGEFQWQSTETEQ